MNLFKFKYHNCSDYINHEQYKYFFSFLNRSKNFKKLISSLTALQIVKNEKKIIEIKKISKKVAKKFKNFCILGTGGSSLGAQAITGLISKTKFKNIFYYDNIDPVFFKNSIDQLKLKDTIFIVISKSGSTPETLGQLGAVLKKFRNLKLNSKISKHFIFITENKQSPLKNIADQFNITHLIYDMNIGGRFSAFSNVALLPAFIAGINIDDFINGAKKTLNSLMKSNNFLPLKGAALSIVLHKVYNINIDIFFTYADCLKYFGKWYQQLWSESIGKNGFGSTPVHSIGTIDQHSQIQLYLDGPKDKFFTFIKTKHTNKGLLMDSLILKNCGLKYIAGKKMGDLMEAEQEATLKTLIDKKLPVREIFLENINAESLGALMMYFMIETISVGKMLKINPFNQPAVEESKALTRKFLS